MKSYYFMLIKLLAIFLIFTEKIEGKTREVIIRLVDPFTNRTSEFCGLQHLYGSHLDHDKYLNRKLSIFHIDDDPCEPQSHVKTHGAGAVHFSLRNYCSLNKVVQKVDHVNSTKVVLVGLGKFIDGDYYYKFNTTNIYLPWATSMTLKKHIESSFNLLIRVEKVDSFDIAYLVLSSIAFFTVFFGAIWLKHDFENRIKILSGVKETEIIKSKSCRTICEKVIKEEELIKDLQQGEKNGETYVSLDKVTAESEISPPQPSDDKKVSKYSSKTLDAIRSSIIMSKMYSNQLKAVKEKLAVRNMETKKNPVEFDFAVLNLILLIILWFSLIFLLLTYMFDFYVEMLKIPLAAMATLFIFRTVCFLLEGLFYPRLSHPYRCTIPGSLRFGIFLVSLLVPTHWLVNPEALDYLPLLEIFGVFACCLWVSVFFVPSFKYCTLVSFATIFYVLILNYAGPFSWNKRSLTDIVMNTPSNDQTPTYNGFYTSEITKIPGIIYMPFLSYEKMICSMISMNKYAYMGFIDIVIPGHFITYAMIFDCLSGKKNFLYFSLNIFTYLITLLCTYVAYSAMDFRDTTIYVVGPMLFYVNLLISILNNEFDAYWSGSTIKTSVNEIAEKMAKNSVERKNNQTNNSIQFS